ncbi:hypothetical protein SDC9_104924 [bioreactor metagenome]|uniref:Uncharacterized protein n=1 Tax=bioreactor metagenome TaxID=1076179 RepID=A0A645AXX3_9ZZZZ
MHSATLEQGVVAFLRTFELREQLQGLRHGGVQLLLGQLKLDQVVHRLITERFLHKGELFVTGQEDEERQPAVLLGALPLDLQTCFDGHLDVSDDKVGKMLFYCILKHLSIAYHRCDFYVELAPVQH